MVRRGGITMMFDYEKALERFMGEKDILLEVLPPYIENIDKCVEELKQLNPKSDCSKIREIAHSIKGSSLNLDIVKLGKEAEYLEDLAYNENSKKIPSTILKLIEYVEHTKVELQAYLI